MTKIEWTEKTWNPIVGCSIVSPGCTNCYAMRMAARIEAMGNVSHYAGLTKKVNGNAVWTGKMALHEAALQEPLRRKKPTTYFVNSMGDLFHEDIPDAWIDKAFAVMALAPQHTFQVLTKRAERMRNYIWRGAQHASADLASWPLPNVWLGVSTERQKEADERIPLLMQTPAAVRFVSAEPLLGPLTVSYLEWARLDWVICGGESGPGARPMHPQWARDLRDNCEAAGIPFFFKQWGGWAPNTTARDRMIVNFDGDVDIPDNRVADERAGEVEMVRAAKAHAGRTLDGKIHDAMPGAMQREAM